MLYAFSMLFYVLFAWYFEMLIFFICLIFFFNPCSFYLLDILKCSYLLFAWYFAMFISFICLIFCNDYIFYSLDILQNVCFLLDNLQCFILYLPDILQSLYVLFAWYFAMFICTMPWFCQDQGRVMDTSRWRSWGPGRHAQRPGRGPSPGPTAVRDRCPTTCNSSNRW